MWLLDSKKVGWYVEPFRQNTGVWQTDGQTSDSIASRDNYKRTMRHRTNCVLQEMTVQNSCVASSWKKHQQTDLKVCIQGRLVPRRGRLMLAARLLTLLWSRTVMWSGTSVLWQDRSQTNRNWSWSWSCRLRSWSCKSGLGLVDKQDDDFERSSVKISVVCCKLFTYLTIQQCVEYSIKYSIVLNTLKGNCFDDEQYVYCTKGRGMKARSWSCCSGLKNLFLFTSLV